jgi:2',3'-cyclic-nucleotide 2'-phosphodiesterase (5'-nucleotidase family)
LVNAGYGGQYLGNMTLLLKRKKRRVAVDRLGYELVPVSAELPPDQKVEAILLPYLEAYGDQGETVVGEAGALFSRKPLSGRPSSSNLANLVADAYRFATGADFAFVNEGGLRADLNKGPVTVDELHAVLPFDNTLVVFKITGAQLLQIIVNVSSGLISENGVLFPSNLLITGLRSGEPKVLTGSGDPLGPDRLYRVTVGSFIARGGDGHESFPDFEKKWDTKIRTSEALRRYFESKKTIFPDSEARLK